MAKKATQEEPYSPLNQALVSEIGKSTQTTSPLIINVDNSDGENIISGEPLKQRTDQVTVGQFNKKVSEKLDVDRRILLTRSEAQALDQLTMNLAIQLSVPVKVSHVLRSLVGILLDAKNEVTRSANSRENTLTRPPNSDAKALQQFDREIGEILRSALISTSKHR